MTMESCLFCHEPVDSDNDDVREWVTVDGGDLPAHRACAQRRREEDGPTDAQLGWGDVFVPFARNH